MSIVTPTNVAASNGSYSNGILITWEYTGNLSGVSRWDIYRWEAGQAPVYYTSTWGNNLSYLDRLNVWGHPSSVYTHYYYSVAAYSVSYGIGSLGNSDLGYTSFGADTTAPTVSTFSPTDGATGVAVGSNIVVTFSETIARGTGNIELRAGSALGTIVETFNAATST